MEDPQDLAQNQESTPETEPSELEVLRAQLAEAQSATLGALRGQLLAEHRGSVVPELVQGSTPEELAASIEQARAAYSAIADQVRASVQPSSPALPNVARAATGTGGGGGSSAPPMPSMESLSPMQKIQSAFSRNGKH